MNTKLFLSIGAALAIAVSAPAQQPGPYTIGRWNGDTGANAAIAPATSVTNTIATSEYNSAKMLFSVRGDGASTANVIIRTYRTLSSTKYEMLATTNLLALNGTTEVSAVIDLSETYLGNVAGLKLVIDNTNAATVSITNIVGRVRFNAPSVRIKGS